MSPHTPLRDEWTGHGRPNYPPEATAQVTARLTRARDTALLTTMRYLCGTPDEQGVTPTEYILQAARSELERALAAKLAEAVP